MTTLSKAVSISELAVGDVLPSRDHKPDNAELFFYNAALWNAHRIHYDLPYAIEEEGYEGLVIAGPMIGDWMAQAVDNWIAEHPEADQLMIAELDYSNRIAAYIGETLTAGGTIIDLQTASGQTRIKIELFVKNERDEVITPGKAVVMFAEAPATGAST